MLQIDTVELFRFDFIWIFCFILFPIPKKTSARSQLTNEKFAQNEPFSGSAVYVAPLLRYPHPYNETHKVQSIKGTFFRIEGWIWGTGAKRKLPNRKTYAFCPMVTFRYGVLLA